MVQTPLFAESGARERFQGFSTSGEMVTESTGESLLVSQACTQRNKRKPKEDVD